MSRRVEGHISTSYKRESILVVPETPKKVPAKPEKCPGTMVIRGGTDMAHVIGRLDQLEVYIKHLHDTLCQEELGECSIEEQVAKLTLKK